MLKKITTKSVIFVCMGLLLATTVGCSQEHRYLSKVQQLMTELGLPACSGLKTCVDVTQKAWLRTAGKELWQIEQTQEDKRALVMPYLTRLSLVDAIQPMYAEYDYVVILGATVASMRHRLTLLADYWKEGIRFKHIVLLAGQRPLDQKKELDLLISEGVAPEALPTTEHEAFVHVFKEADLPLQVRALPVTVVNAPCVMQKDGTCKRPSMGDTVTAWLETDPVPGSVLAIAHQPFCLYSHVMLATVLPKSFKSFSRLEVVGSKAAESTTVAGYLDSLARILYQLNKSGYSALEQVMAYIPGYDQTA